MTEPLDVNLNLIRGELDDLLGLEEGLTDWEIGFLQSLADRLELRPLPLSDKQIGVLHRMWDKHFQ